MMLNSELIQSYVVAKQSGVDHMNSMAGFVPSATVCKPWGIAIITALHLFWKYYSAESG
jgi:hypothetical protein